MTYPLANAILDRAELVGIRDQSDAHVGCGVRGQHVLPQQPRAKVCVSPESDEYNEHPQFAARVLVRKLSESERDGFIIFRVFVVALTSHFHRAILDRRAKLASKLSRRA